MMDLIKPNDYWRLSLFGNLAILYVVAMPLKAIIGQQIIAEIHHCKMTPVNHQKTPQIWAKTKEYQRPWINPQGPSFSWPHVHNFN